jgi:hypothetical protein
MISTGLTRYYMGLTAGCYSCWPPTRGNALRGGPTNRRGHAVSLAAQARWCFPGGCCGRDGRQVLGPTESCSHHETFGSKVCDLVLGLVDGRVHLAARLEEVVWQLRVMRDEHEALWSSTTCVRGLELGRFDETPPLAVVLSPSTEPTAGRVNAATINRVQWGLGCR